LHTALEKLEQPKAGFRAFRRYRLTWLRKNRVHADLERFDEGSGVHGSILGDITEFCARALARRHFAVCRTWIAGHGEVFEYLQVAAPVDTFPRYLPKGTKEFHDHVEPGGGQIHKLEKLSCNAAQCLTCSPHPQGESHDGSQ
jgi:hypothetical protein